MLPRKIWNRSRWRNLEKAVDILDSLPAGNTESEKIKRLIVTRDGLKAIVREYAESGTDELMRYRGLGKPEEIERQLSELKTLRDELATI